MCSIGFLALLHFLLLRIFLLLMVELHGLGDFVDKVKDVVNIIEILASLKLIFTAECCANILGYYLSI